MNRPERRDVRRLAARLLVVISDLNPAGVDEAVAADEYGHLADQVAYRALGDSRDSAADWLARELTTNWGFEPELAESAANKVVKGAVIAEEVGNDGVSISVMCFGRGALTDPPEPLGDRKYTAFADYVSVELGTAHVYEPDYSARNAEINKRLGLLLRGLIDDGIDPAWLDANDARIEVYCSLHPGAQSGSFRINAETIELAALVRADFRFDYI